MAFECREDAEKAVVQHICLCRNEDLLLPDMSILEMAQEEFEQLDGYELRFEMGPNSFLVGHNRFKDNEEMFGYIEIVGNPIRKDQYE